jgi:DNA gyrase inhibitor GyrI
MHFNGIARVVMIWKLIFDEVSGGLYAVAAVTGMHNSMSKHV